MAVENRLIDTNVLVYAYDVSEKARRRAARSLLGEVWDQGGGVVTLQNLSEFFVVVTEKVEQPITVSEARTVISDILRSSRWLVIDRQARTMMKAIEFVEITGVPYWDALIAACLLEHGIHTIITENERDFRRIPGITVVNPFKERVKR
ncbi:MAG: PIN domain-containing protein [Deltaproteobacteria bacterium]|nr:PIN domain-containing protein [Deltaproteobacteria bacterium]